ncbi:MAG: hypothetical protein KJO92_06810, partial [Gammaproteobacteria bacterium]|nr:hypothetical protein [Gammaproteobacteria bacterium]
MNTLSNLIAISHDRKLPALSLFLMLLWLPQQVMAVDELGIFELEGNPTDSTDGSFLDNGVDSENILNGDPEETFKFSLFGTDDIDIDGPDQDTTIFKTGNAIKDDALISTWEWKVGDPSDKVDIHNAWAATTVYQGDLVRATAPAVAPGTLITIPGEGTFSAVEGSVTNPTNKSGLVSFTPVSGFTGESSIYYAVCDTPGNGNSGAFICDSALLTVVVAADPAGNVAPQPHDDLIKTEVGLTTTIRVLRNDIDLDGDTLTLDAITTPTFGSVLAVGNTIQYTAPAVFATDSFTYEACDSSICVTATVNIEVNIDDDNRVSAVSDYVLIRPGAALTNYNVLLNDTDPEAVQGLGDQFDFDVGDQGAFSSGLLPWDDEHRPGDAILYFGLDVTNEYGGNVGDSAHSFWFFQDENVAPDGAAPAQTSGSWNGQHRRYDVLIQTNVGGSGIASGSVFVWDPNNGPSSYPRLNPASDG